MIKKILFIVMILTTLLPSSHTLVNPCKKYDKETDFYEMKKDCMSYLKTDDIYIHTSNIDENLFCCRTRPIKNAFYKKYKPKILF